MVRTAEQTITNAYWQPSALTILPTQTVEARSQHVVRDINRPHLFRSPMHCSPTMWRRLETIAGGMQEEVILVVAERITGGRADPKI